MKGKGNLSFSYLKSPLIKTFQTDAPHGYILSTNMKMTRRHPFLKGIKDRSVSYNSYSDHKTST